MEKSFLQEYHMAPFIAGKTIVEGGETHPP